jgi:CheY-like chemotaxis protein
MATVMVVEDVPANRALVVKLLRAAGHEVIDA